MKNTKKKIHLKFKKNTKKKTKTGLEQVGTGLEQDQTWIKHGEIQQGFVRFAQLLWVNSLTGKFMVIGWKKTWKK